MTLFTARKSRSACLSGLSRVLVKVALMGLCCLVSGASIARGDLVWDAHFSDEQQVVNGMSIYSHATTVTLGTSVFSDFDGGTFDLQATRSAFFHSYESGMTGAQSGNLELTFDNENDDFADFLELQMDFSVPVLDLRFSILDVDGESSNAWDDGVEVFVNGINVRSNPSWYSLGGLVIADNESYMTGFEAIPASASSTETTGNIDLNFGALQVSNITIRYFSTDDAIANPVSQFIAVSDLQYTAAIPESASTILPVLIGMAVTCRRRSRNAFTPTALA